MSRRPLVALLAVGAAVFLLLFGFARQFGRDPHEVPFGLKGQPAPNFTLTRLDTGEKVTLAQLRGQPLVLNFWASWCAPCQLEHPTLTRAAQRYGNEAHFFGVVFEDTVENARNFAHQTDPSFPQLVDPQSRMAVDYGVSGVPETYFIDAEGIIRDKAVGPLLDVQEVASRLAALQHPRSSAGARR